MASEVGRLLSKQLLLKCIGCFASSLPASVVTSQAKVTTIEVKDVNEMTEPRLHSKMFVTILISIFKLVQLCKNIYLHFHFSHRFLHHDSKVKNYY